MTTQETLLAALRGRFGDSQTAIADATGMSLSRLNNYFRGTRRMDDDAVIACCELLAWNAQKYVAAHRAENATTRREISFWKKVSGSAAAALVVAFVTIPSHAAYLTADGNLPPDQAPAMGIMRIARLAVRAFMGIALDVAAYAESQSSRTLSNTPGMMAL